MKNRPVSGIMQREHLSALLVTLNNGAPGAGAGGVLQTLARDRINLEFVDEVPLAGGGSGLLLCVDQKDGASAAALIENMSRVSEGPELQVLGGAGVLSVFPHRDRAALVGTILQVLAGAGVTLLAIGTSLSTVSCVVREKEMPEAVRVLSREFGLD